MKDINELKNYREKYKRYYGINFGKEFAIHHIDGDRSNNDIKNLLLLPADLHSKYHGERLNIETAFNNNLCTKLTYSGIKLFELQLWYLDKYTEVLKDVSKWVELKFLVDCKTKSYVDIKGISEYGV